jgi:hypothetical protein
MQTISAHLAKLNAREQNNECSNVTSTSTERDKLPNKPKINSRREAKAIISRDEISDSKLPNI